MKEKKLLIVVIILSVLLVSAAGYIIFGKYKESVLQKESEAYNTGIYDGYEQAVIDLHGMLSKCQQVPITVQNQTINLIAVECLNSE